MADLWHASSIMHGRPNGILAELDRLRIAHERELDRQLSSGWTHPLVIAAGAGPSIVLLSVLLIAQTFIRRRFRRILVPPLLAATTLLVAGAAVMAVIGGLSNAHLDESRTALRDAVTARQAEAEDASVHRRQALVRLLADLCGPAVDGCGPTIEQFGAAARGLEAGRSEPGPMDDVTDSRRVNDRLQAARIAVPIPFLVAAAFLAVMALIQLGFHPRIDEYRFQRR